jgi:PilZ domain
MTEPKNWLEKFLKPDSRKTERRSVHQFAAYRWNGSTLKQDAVRDISSTGVYILTKERWQRGMLVWLTLQKEGRLEKSLERRIGVQAKVVRWGEDGVGLEFVLPNDPESRQWECLRESLIEESKPDDLLDLVRMEDAFAFLSRICPGGAEEIGQLVRGRLSNLKVANAVEIVLKAESLLAFEPASQRLRADTRLVVRILENGSCTDEDWLKHFWGGILATSCSVDGKDELNLVFVELLSQLTTFPVRILTVVCTRATKFLSESGLIFARPLACNLEEIANTTASRGLRIEHDLELLSDLGLIEKGDSNSPSLLPSGETDITPSALGLELFARCNGHKGSMREFYALASRDTLILANERYPSLTTSEVRA